MGGTEQKKSRRRWQLRRQTSIRLLATIRPGRRRCFSRAFRSIAALPLRRTTPAPSLLPTLRAQLIRRHLPIPIAIEAPKHLCRVRNFLFVEYTIVVGVECSKDRGPMALPAGTSASISGPLRTLRTFRTFRTLVGPFLSHNGDGLKS